MGWQDIMEMISQLESGGIVQVGRIANTKMPADVLKALKACHGILEIDFGDYICQIDSSQLNDSLSDFAVLDLGVNMVKDLQLSKAAGDKDIYQLHFNYHGELPGIISYKFKAVHSQPGETLFMYYLYSQAGIIEGMQSAVVDENGNVTFSFYHCSSYFVSSTIIQGSFNCFTQPTERNTASSQLPVWLFIICLVGAVVVSIAGTLLVGRRVSSRGTETAGKARGRRTERD